MSVLGPRMGFSCFEFPKDFILVSIYIERDIFYNLNFFVTDFLMLLVVSAWFYQIPVHFSQTITVKEITFASICANFFPIFFGLGISITAILRAGMLIILINIFYTEISLRKFYLFLIVFNFPLTNE